MIQKIEKQVVPKARLKSKLEASSDGFDFGAPALWTTNLKSVRGQIQALRDPLQKQQKLLKKFKLFHFGPPPVPPGGQQESVQVQPSPLIPIPPAQASVLPEQFPRNLYTKDFTRFQENLWFFHARFKKASPSFLDNLRLFESYVLYYGYGERKGKGVSSDLSELQSEIALLICDVAMFSEDIVMLSSTLPSPDFDFDDLANIRDVFRYILAITDFCKSAAIFSHICAFLCYQAAVFFGPQTFRSDHEYQQHQITCVNFQSESLNFLQHVSNYRTWCVEFVEAYSNFKMGYNDGFNTGFQAGYDTQAK